MAAAPVRLRSGPGGPRAQLPPCYYEGYLEKRGPSEKVCRNGERGVSAMLQCALWTVVVGVFAPGLSPIPSELSTSSL